MNTFGLNISYLSNRPPSLSLSIKVRINTTDFPLPLGPHKRDEHGSDRNGAFGCLTVGPESLFNGFTCIIYITVDAFPNARRVNRAPSHSLFPLLFQNQTHSTRPDILNGRLHHNTGTILLGSLVVVPFTCTADHFPVIQLYPTLSNFLVPIIQIIHKLYHEFRGSNHIQQ